MTFGLQKHDEVIFFLWCFEHIFLVVFKKNEILKNAVSKRCFTDSSPQF